MNRQKLCSEGQGFIARNSSTARILSRDQTERAVANFGSRYFPATDGDNLTAGG